MTYHENGVDQVPLESLPDTDFPILATHTDDVIGGVCQAADLALMGQNTVDASAAHQVPQTDHPILGSGSGAHRLWAQRIDKSRRDGAAVPEEVVDVGVVRKFEDADRVILRAREQKSATRLQGVDWFLMGQDGLLPADHFLAALDAIRTRKGCIRQTASAGVPNVNYKR